MRVIAGEAKGIPLKAPEPDLARPATALVKGAIFSILENMTERWALILDIFSGSGQLGIEALSRGAGWVDFVERNPKCCAIIKWNLERTKLAASARVYCADVEKALSFLDKEYDIVLMDPPYKDPSISEIVNKVANSKVIGRDTVLVVTHSPRQVLQPAYDSVKLVKEHRHGDSIIAIYRKEDS